MELVGLKVRQWHPEWEKVYFSETQRRRRPAPEFYLFSMRASHLKAICGIQRRTVQDGVPRSQDTGIQRSHEKARSDEIREFVRYGYPWSELSASKRASGDYDDLRMPGWLPTAIVVNILTADDVRRGMRVAHEDLIHVNDNGDGSTVRIELPRDLDDTEWTPSQLAPMEVIDGQHRLWAFEDVSDMDDYELPVVAFHGLDIAWQAYLFWTINIRPKRINPSLAFDLYPLLRTQDWLDRFHGHSIYRQTRAQELTEALWSHPTSPWYHRINMLGERGGPRVSQAAWIRALMATYVKSWESAGRKLGGLFGAPVGTSDTEALPWTRTQQAAFLIFMTSTVADAVAKCDQDWAKALRDEAERQSSREDHGPNPAFTGPYTLLNTDQGVRGLLHVTNDLCYLQADALKLRDWMLDVDEGTLDETAISRAIQSLESQEVAGFLREIAQQLATFDWRTFSAPGIDEDQRRKSSGYRGSGGYRMLRRDLLSHLSQGKGRVAETARDVLERIRDS